MKVLDFFSGIGGFHSAFKRVGWDVVGFCEIDKFARQSYKALYDTEGVEEWHDITKVSEHEFQRFSGTVDLIAGGFPCQAFSVAGRRGGFEDTRGTLFFEIARVAKIVKPRYLLLENVKGLLNHDKGHTFGTILNSLHELGYGHIEWAVLNSKYWGIPQNRERVFILAELTDAPQRPYLLPLLTKEIDTGVTSRLRDVLEENVDEKYYLSEDKTSKLIEVLKDRIKVKEATKKGYAEAFVGDSVNLSQPNSKTRRGRVGKELANTLLTGQEQAVIIPNTDVIADLKHYSHESLNRVYGPDGQSPTLSTMQGGGREPKVAEPQEFSDGSGIAYCLDACYTKGTSAGNVGKGRRTHAIEVRATITPDREEKRQNGRRFKEDDEPMFTINVQDKHGVTFIDDKEYRIRKLTPLECWRLQDFSDEQFYTARASGVSDSQLYKQAGNSVTVKVVEVIAREIEKRL